MRTILLGMCTVIFGSLLVANNCFAAGEVVEIVKTEGAVFISASSGGQPMAVSTQSVVPYGAVLYTGANSRAVVRMGSSGIIVLGHNSKVGIDSGKDFAGFLRHITGMIYYAVNTLKGGQRRLEVQTKSATIGIRGTRFMIVDQPGRNEIDMRKGLVSVISPEGDFEIHRNAEKTEFEAYKQEGLDAMANEKKAFDEYKDKTAREFLEYKREFSLGANRMASFDGKKVVDAVLSDQSNEDMRSAESFAEKWLGEVRD
jgi:hypothetical protein